MQVAVLYAALFLVMGYPLPFHAGSMTLPGDPDTDLFMWTLGWNTHALVDGPLSIFDANIYHPYRRTLAFSENLIGSTIFAAPVLWTSGNHVLALNAVGFSSVVLCGVGAWLLARRLGAGHHAAIVAGLIFAYSPARFLRFGQLHLTTIQWIPFSLAFLHAYLDGGRKRDLRLAIAFFTLQVLASGHGATFLTVAIVCVLAYRFALGEPVALGRRVRDLGITGVLLFLPVLMVLVPYRKVQLELGLRRTLEGGWAPAPESFLASPSIFHLWLLSHFPDAQVVERASAWLFPGFLPLLLAGAAIAARFWLGPRPRPGQSWTWAVIAGALEAVILVSLAVGLWTAFYGPIRFRVGTVLLLTARDPYRPWIVFASSVILRVAIGRRVEFAARVREWGRGIRPGAQTIRRDPIVFYSLLLLVSMLFTLPSPLGIWPFVYYLPGFNFIRVPSRFVLLATLALAVLAAFGFQRLTAHLSFRRQGIVASTVGTVMLAEFLTIPLPAIQPVRVEIPTVDRWLDTQPKPFVVAEVPTNTYERLQSTYMLHSMAHWQRIVNGHSGMRTTLHEVLFEQLSAFPDAVSLRALAELDVTYVVVHREFYSPDEWPEIERRLRRYGDWLELVVTDGVDRVYRLRAPPPT